MTERETKTVTTPKGHEVVLYTYVTAGEKIQIYKSGDTETLETLIKVLVKTPTYDEVMDFHGADLDFLISEMTSIAYESSWNKEKKV